MQDLLASLTSLTALLMVLASTASLGAASLKPEDNFRGQQLLSSTSNDHEQWRVGRNSIPF